jgi:tRNA-modifying protein YgfZ
MFAINLNNELAILVVSGIDSKPYLQGQLTNDINLLDSQPFQLSAHLNNKGRMLASFIITRVSENTYYLFTNKDILTKVLPRLKMFVLRSKVTFNESTLIPVLSDHTFGSVNSIELCPNHFLSTLEASTINLTTNNNLWHQFLVNQLIPLIYTDTYEKFTPQQVNYELINGVSFTKGCYTGQEIVARTHYLGKVKRRMYLFSCNNPVKMGQTITSPTMDNQEVGFVVDVARDDNYYIGLASVQIDCVNDAFINNHKLTLKFINHGKTIF